MESTQNFNQFKHEATSSETLAFVENQLKSAPTEFIAMLRTAVDDSDHSLEQWLNAFVTFQKWLNDVGSALSFENQLGYIECCASSASNGPKLDNLSGIVLDMLQNHGCDAATRQ